MINARHMQHGVPWSGEDVRGWYASEKLDGCRAYWDGDSMWTKQGNRVRLPREWERALPQGVHLDGEIWAGRGRFPLAVNAVVNGRWAAGVCFMVFDAPQVAAPWVGRLVEAQRAIKRSRAARFAATVPWQTVESWESVAALFRAVRAGGGEGLMLRRPDGDSGYRAGRSSRVLKLKRDTISRALRMAGLLDQPIRVHTPDQRTLSASTRAQNA